MDNKNQSDQMEVEEAITANPVKSKSKQVVVEARYLRKSSQSSKSTNPTPVSTVLKSPTPTTNVKHGPTIGIFKQPSISVENKIRQPPNKKSKPPIYPNSISNHEENSPSIVQARYWRNQLKLLNQRKEFDKERQRMFNELESMTNDRMDMKRRTNECKHLSKEIVQLQLALGLLEIQMPELVRVHGKRLELETKLERFTSALKLFLACVMIVDSKNVSVPKTDAEMGLLAQNIAKLNTDLTKLSQTLGVDDMDASENRIAIITAVHQLLETTDLFFAAFHQVNENKTLLEKLEELKTSEDSLKAYLYQLEKQKVNQHSYRF